MSEFPFKAWYWECNNPPKHSKIVRMPKRTMGNMFTDPVEYLTCLKCPVQWDESNPKHKPKDYKKVRWLWRCGLCLNDDKGPSMVSWRDDFCHKPGCGGSWLAHGSKKLDGGSPSEWSNDHKQPSKKDVDEAQKKKDAGEKHKSHLKGCPAGCPGEHMFEFKLICNDDVLIHEERTTLFAWIDPALDPNKPKEVQGKLRWKITSGAKSASFIRDEGGVEKKVTEFETNAADTEALLETTDKSGKVQVECTFDFGSHEPDSKDKPKKRSVSLKVTKLRREPGETEAFGKSQFTLEPWPKYKHPAERLRKHAKAWILYDFEVGSPDFPDVKLETFNKTTSWPMLERLGEQKQVDVTNKNGTFTFYYMRCLALRGYTDKLGDEFSNDVIRSTRRKRLIGRLKQQGAWHDFYIMRESELAPEEIAAFDETGTYPAPNSSAEERRLNRSVICFEVFRDVTSEVVPEEDPKLRKARFKNFHKWYFKLREETKGSKLECMLTRTDSPTQGHMQAIGEEYLNTQPLQDYLKFAQRYRLKRAKLGEIYWSFSEVYGWTNYTSGQAEDKEPSELDDMVAWGSSITTSLIYAAINADTYAQFKSKALQMVPDVDGGFAALQKVRTVVESFGQDIHFGVKALAQWLDSYRRDKSGQYACWKEQLDDCFAKDWLTELIAPSDE